jgi:D-glycero-D-manno-heptose 1,7-bisphosphate phosphatase
MKQPAIFFDRDNTLILNDGYLGDPAGVRLAPGAADAVARAHELGYLVVIVSNQSGVARGMFSEADVNAVDARMNELLLADNPRARVDLHEFCPFHPEGSVAAYRMDSELRKPKPGMILRAATKLNIDLSRSWLVGDAGRDIEAGKAAGCRTILVRWPGIAQSPAAVEKSSVQPNAVVSSLDDAMQTISAHSLH